MKKSIVMSAGVALALALVGGGVQANAATTTYKLCVDKAKLTLVVKKTACSSSQVEIKGATGLRGATGSQGPAGANGANGANGLNGQDGAQRVLQALQALRVLQVLRGLPVQPALRDRQADPWDLKVLLVVTVSTVVMVSMVL